MNITKDFRIIYYNGGEKSESRWRQCISISNILNTEPNFHCSKNGSNFDIILKFMEDGYFSLINFTIMGPFKCTAPIKTGIVFISKKLMNEKVINLYTSKYDHLTMKEYQHKGYDRAQNENEEYEECFFFETDSVLYEYVKKFDEPIIGKYIHIKFIEGHGNDMNIDILRIGIVGFYGEINKYNNNNPNDNERSLLEMKLIRRKICKFNDLGKYEYSSIYFSTTQRKKANLVLFTNDVLEIDLYKNFSEMKKYQQKFHFFYSGFDGGFAKKVLKMFGYCKNDDDLYSDNSLLIIYGIDKRKYVCEKEEITTENIKQFLDGFLKNKLKVKLKSKCRPMNNENEDTPGLKIIVANSFDEIVLSNSNDVLVNVGAQWARPSLMINEVIETIACVFKDIDGIDIGYFDVEENDVDKRYFPENTIPNVKFFPMNNKDKPIKYEGKRNGESIIQFIHQHCSKKIKFNVKEVIDKFKSNDALRQKIRKIKMRKEEIEKDFGICKEKMEKEKGMEIEKLITRMDITLKSRNKNLENIQEIINEIEGAKLLSPLDKLAEKIRLKEVIKIESYNQFEEVLKNPPLTTRGEQDSKGLVLTLFTAEWCAPCKRIEPLYCDLSRDYHQENVVFLIVDVDKNSELCLKKRVKSVPTFQFYQDSEKIDEYLGSNIEKVKELISTFKSI